MSALDWSTLAPEYAKLSVYLEGCRAWVMVAPINGYARDPFNSRLNVSAGWLGRLGPTGDLGLGVINGTFTAERWVQIANLQGAAIYDVWKEASPAQFLGRVWTEIVVKTASDTKTAVVDVAKATTPTLALVAVILGLWLALKVTK